MLPAHNGINLKSCELCMALWYEVFGQKSVSGVVDTPLQQPSGEVTWQSLSFPVLAIFLKHGVGTIPEEAADSRPVARNTEQANDLVGVTFTSTTRELREYILSAGCGQDRHVKTQP
jgi:hypothetical protein